MKVIKWVLIIICLVFIGSVTVFVWFYSSNPQKLLELLSKQLHDSYLLDIKASGAEFNLFKGLELKGVSISSGSRELLYFSRGGLLYNPIALINNKVEIISISVRGLNTTPENIISIYDRFSVKNISGKKTIPIIVHRLSISDSIITYNKIPFRTEITVSPDRKLYDMPLSLTLRSSNANLDYKGTLNSGFVKITGTDIDSLFNTATALKIQALEGGVKRDNDNNIHLDGKELKINYGNFYFESLKTYNLDFIFKTLTLSLTQLDIRSGNSSAQIKGLTYSIPSGSLAVDAESLALDPGDLLKGAAGKITGDFNLNSGKETFISGNLKLQDVKYSWISSTEGSVRIDSNSLEAAISMKAPGIKADMKINCGNLFSGGVQIHADAGNIDMEALMTCFSNSNTAKSPAALFPLKIFPVILTVNAGKITYKKFELTDLYLDINASDPDMITVKELKAGLFRGNVLISMVLSHGNISGDAAITGIKLKEFSRTFLEGGRKIYGSADITGNFNIPVNDFTLAKAAFDAKINNGEIKDFFLQEEIAKTLFDIPLNDIFFDSIHARGSLQGSILSIGELTLDSTDITAQASGGVSFKEKTLTVRSDISFADSYLSGLPNFAQILTSGHQSGDRLNFSLIIDGELAKPAVKIE